jgi:bifunctional non-homologous end joining protein LigD
MDFQYAMPLKKYFQKRDFKITREPHGREHKASKHRFLIHEHHATRLHFDLRLEAEGVLKSWAVPKGPSMNPNEKHLAVMVEDHPIEYGSFEGAIPEGQYGAGEVRIWDSGTYEEIGAPLVQQIKNGKMTFILKGKKLKGEFHMVRIRSKEQSPYTGENNWLIFKHEDKYADPEWTMKTILNYGSRSEAPGRAKKKTTGKDALKKLVSASRKKSTSTSRKKAISKPRATTRLKSSAKTKSARTKTAKRKS